MEFLAIVTIVIGLLAVALLLWKQRRSTVKNLETKFAVRDGITFYDNPLSPCAQRVRITLREKGIKHHVVVVDILSKENRHPAFLAINPLGKVPVMVVHSVKGITDCCLFESNAITEWLDEQFPNTVQLYPSDPWDRVQVKMWQKWEGAMAEDFWPLMYANTMGFLVRALYSRASFAEQKKSSDKYYFTKQMKAFDGELLTQQQMRQQVLRLFRWLDILEGALVGKKFLFSNAFTTADISVIPRVAMYNHIGLLESPEERLRYPNVIRYLKEVTMRPSFQLSMSLLNWIPWPFIEWVGNWRTGKNFRRVYGKNLLHELEHCHSKPVEMNRYTNETAVTLYCNISWPDSIAARITLSELAISAQSREVDVMLLEHKSANYLYLNPCGDVPTLVHNDRVIYDSRIISEYVNAVMRHDSAASLLPSDPTERVLVRVWQGWSNTCFNYQLIHLYKWYITSRIVKSTFSSKEELILALHKSTSASEFVDEIVLLYVNETPNMSPYKSALVAALQHLNTELENRVFLVGSELSVADISVFSMLILFKWVGVAIPKETYPNVHVWKKMLLSRGSFSIAKSEVDSFMLSNGIKQNN